MKKILTAIILPALFLALGQLAAGYVETNPLVQAAMTGDTAEVQKLLRQGADIEVRDPRSGRTALTGAAEAGKAEMVKLLLEKGAKIEARDGGGNTALYGAAREGQTEVVKLLLDKGANTEASDHDGETPLIWAAYEGHAEVVKLLLDKGAAIEARKKNGDTALFLAALQGRTEAVRVLLDKGANIEARHDGTALIWAASSNMAELVKLLLDKGANIEATDDHGDTALHRTLQNPDNRIDVVKLLLDRGANIEARNDFGWTPLHQAASRGRADVVKLLLDKGANLEARDKEGFTPLLRAAEAGGSVRFRGQGADIVKFPAVDVVSLLLSKGANIEARSDWGQTALHRAAFRDRPDVVEFLLDKGANIQAMDNHGNTPLTLANATREGWERIAREEEITGNSRGLTVARATLSNHDEVVRVLEQALSKHPPSSFADYVNDLQNHPRDRARRNHVVKLAAALPTPPTIPEQARRLFERASELMKQANGEKELAQPINLLRGALVIAPWWGDAYHQLSRALELTGQYDLAVKNLNYYLELNPPDAEARAARAHLAEIPGEKEAAAGKKQRMESALALKYISGGATRMRPADAPAWWKPDDFAGVERLYLYSVPEEEPFYANAFRMPNGRILVITLNAQSKYVNYAGDQIAVWDKTDNSCPQPQGYSHFNFGAQSSADACGVGYDVSVSSPPNATVTVTNKAAGASVTLPVNLLYRGRALKGGMFGTVYQGGEDIKVLHFNPNVVDAARDPSTNAMSLTPTRVVPYQKENR